MSLCRIRSPALVPRIISQIDSSPRSNFESALSCPFFRYIPQGEIQDFINRFVIWKQSPVFDYLPQAVIQRFDALTKMCIKIRQLPLDQQNHPTRPSGQFQMPPPALCVVSFGWTRALSETATPTPFWQTRHRLKA